VAPLSPVTSTATVAAGSYDGAGASLSKTAGAPLNAVVATFTPSSPVADISHLYATVTWVDPDAGTAFPQYFTQPTIPVGPPPSAGALTLNSDGTLSVAASIPFSDAGSYSYLVTLSDDRIAPGLRDANAVGVAYGSVAVS
jgi:hypothetical protein